MIRLSTGLRDLLLGTDDFRSIFENGVIHIYTGAQPANADQAVAGTLLGIVTQDALPFSFGSPDNGLNFAAPASAAIDKEPGENWRYSALASGVAGWGRLMGNALDNLASSTVLPRVDFRIGQSGADLNLTSTSLAAGAPYTIDQFRLRIPFQIGGA